MQGRSPAVKVKGDLARPGPGGRAAHRGRVREFRRETSPLAFLEAAPTAFGGVAGALDGAAVTLNGGDFTARGGNDAWGIYNTGSSTTLETESVTALAKNGNYNYSLVNESGGAATLYGGSFVGSGGWTSYGINNTGSSTTLVAEGITVLAENGANWSTALNNENNASARLYGAFFTGRAGLYSRGIWNGSSGTLYVNNVTALAKDGSNNSWGLLNYSGVTTGNNSQFIGGSDGLYLEGGSVSLGVSQLDGGVDLVSGTLTCFQVYDENYAAYICP